MLTSLALLSIYKSPTIPLEEVCGKYFGISREEAMKRAARNELPIPTFRLADSQKAPLMVSCEDLAAHIDRVRAKASESWQRSQL